MSPHWSALTARHSDEKQCLACFVAWQAAEVISRAKPANLINIFDRQLTCGRNIHTLWERYREEVFAASDIRAVELQRKGDRLLVLMYHPQALATVLWKKAVRTTLTKLGYRYATTEEALAHLGGRLQDDGFPHEIGFFLGYPIKDVLAFMGLCKLPLAGNGSWKMYGRLETSLATRREHLSAREAVLKALAVNPDPLHLLHARDAVVPPAA